MIDRRRATGLLFSLVVVLHAAVLPLAHSASISAQLTTKEKNQLQREARMVVDLVQNLHFSGGTFYDIKNQEIIDRYLSELDPAGEIFSPDDVKFIHQRFDRSLKSVYLFRGDLEPAFEIFDLYAQLARARFAWVNRRLSGDFDFTVDETYSEPRPGVPPSSGLSLDKRWELRLKDEMLHEILSGRTPDEARAKLRENYAEVASTISAFDSFAVREHFLDAAIRCFDPHSGYSSADSTREFAVNMKGTITGVGLAMRKEHGDCIVTEVNAGGPADLHSSVAPGDHIEALAQGDGPWVETHGQRLRETVAIMRGLDHEKLRIAYTTPGKPERKEVTLERGRVVLSGDRAHGAISQVPVDATHSIAIGWIVLPAFYAGGEGDDTTSASRDVRELIDQMTAAKISGLVLDLRGNPGGALTEAEDMCRLFLPQGTALLSRGINGALKRHTFKEDKPHFDGPLVVLTSPFSASASEIFAGAMKYHHRALIVGGPATFGKGTSQNYIDLAKAQNLTGDSVKDWGMLRLTAERFYLPDGTAIQRRGVPSDVILPGFVSPGQLREADLPHALPPEDVTPPADPSPEPAAKPALSTEQLRALEALATEDFGTLPEWKSWQKDHELRWVKADRHTRSLLKEKRSKDWETLLTEFKTARQTRREFATHSAYPTQRVDLALVRDAADSHQAKLRALQAAGSQTALHRLQNGVFLVDTEHGHLRDLRLQDFDFLPLASDAESLAEAFSQGSGRKVTPGDMRATLQQLALLDPKTDEAVLAVTAKLAGAPADSPATRNGTEALLLRITELEPELREELPGFDVPMRECLRLSARWANQPASSQP